MRVLLAACLFSIGLGTASTGIAQTSQSPPAIRDLVINSVDTSKRIALGDPVASWATVKNDLGAVPSELFMRHLTIELNRSSEREQAFQRLLQDQQDSTSPTYHQWLTPVEVGDRFGASQHDIDAISAWLSAQGLRVESISNSRTRIVFSGTASVLAKTFATSLHYYRAGDRIRVANSNDPQIPAAFANAVQSVRGLHEIPRRTDFRLSPIRVAHWRDSTWQPADTFCPNGTCQYTIFPADFAKIYDIDTLESEGITGSGQTIAIVGRARVYDADLQNFQNLSGVSFASPTVIVPPDGIDPGPPATTCSTTGTDTCDNPSDTVQDQTEATLDVERAGSVAPGAHVDLIVSADTAADDGSDIATQYAIDTDPVPAKILSISFSSCEADNGSAETQALDLIFQQAAAEGISVFVASGDGGAAGCETVGSTPPTVQTLSTNALCSSGSVTCVGGTEFNDSADPSAYWAPSDGNDFESALGYIPEGAWNDPIDSDTGKTQIAASGGGVSRYISTPSWQTGPGVPGKQGRYTPDVAFAASGREAYFTCVAAQNGSCAVTNGSFGFIGSGGTSAAAPSMAGVAALLNQKMGGAQGNLNPRLYALASAAGNGVFHDVTVASSGVSGCTASVPSLCNNSTPGPTGLSGGLAGYLVGNGFDEATGLGSIDVANMLAQWNPSQSGVNLDQHGLTGSWYNPATAGQGFEVETFPDLNGAGKGLFTAGWFTFDVTAAGGRRWYELSGETSATNTTATVGIYAVYGGNFNAPPVIQANGSVGQATIHFTDCNTGLLTYSFSDGSGRSGTIPFFRLTPNVTCTPSGDNSNAPTDYLLSGNWYDPATSGQGLFFDVSPSLNTIFAAWYTFIKDGELIGGPASQNWFTLNSNQFTDGRTSLNNIPIYETTGGIFNTPAPTTSTQVGTLNIAFQSCDAMTLTYRFTGGENSGSSGSIDLQRVGPTPAGCTLD